MPPAVVMLDLSGVLRLPDASWMLEQLRGLAQPRSRRLVQRAHYRAIGAFDQTSGEDHRGDDVQTYPPAFLTALNVPPQVRGDVRAVLFGDGSDVLRQTADQAALAAVHALVADGAEVLVVTNNTRPGARAWLARAGAAVRGSGGPLTAVIESANVGVAKPDPAILQLALAAVGWTVGDTRPAVFVGDSLRIDGQAACQARVPFWHYDPYAGCNRQDHGHLRHLSELPSRVADPARATNLTVEGPGASRTPRLRVPDATSVVVPVPN